MNTLLEAYNTQQSLLRVGNAMYIASPYYEPIVSYAQIARLTSYELAMILPVLQNFIATQNSLHYIEVLFIGLLAIYNIRPLHYIRYICSKSLDQLQDAIDFAKYTTIQE